MAGSGRVMALGPAHLAKVAREVPRVEYASNLTRITDDEMIVIAERLAKQVDGGPFWLFAYGSLIWKPDFEYVEARRGLVHGWRRSFCLPIRNWRATPEQPGLMLALQQGGACSGIAYRMPEDDPHGRMLRLLKREIASHEGLRGVRWVTVRAPEGAVRALVFYCAPKDGPAVERLTPDEQARRLAQAVGHVGSCAEYLYNTVSHLEALGIRDRYLWDLQARVAAEIDRL
jgi:glutathione-specific gamma-glutamylcyclotransferase